VQWRKKKSTIKLNQKVLDRNENKMNILVKNKKSIIKYNNMSRM